MRLKLTPFCNLNATIPSQRTTQLHGQFSYLFAERGHDNIGALAGYFDQYHEPGTALYQSGNLR
jgi:hypothetical protein